MSDTEEERNLIKGESGPHLKQLLTSLEDKSSRLKSSSKSTMHNMRGQNADIDRLQK